MLHQTLVYCPAPDQVCHQEEMGPMEEGASARPGGQGYRQPSLLPSLEARTQVALNVDLGVPGAQSVRYFRTAVLCQPKACPLRLGTEAGW